MSKAKTIARASARKGTSTTAHTRKVKIRCLSVRQPWATLIAKGKKKFELRTRRSLFTGLLVICSSIARWKGEGKKRDLVALDKWEDIDGPRGYAVAIVRMTGCRLATKADSTGACIEPLRGEYAYELKLVKRLSGKTKVNGALCMFDPPPALARELRALGYA